MAEAEAEDDVDVAVELGRAVTYTVVAAAAGLFCGVNDSLVLESLMTRLRSVSGLTILLPLRGRLLRCADSFG